MDSPSAIVILENLIAINSENPGANEIQIVDYCKHLLSAQGIDIQIIGQHRDRPNIIARLQGRPGRKLIYQAHLDTKPSHHEGATSGHWSYPPFKATRVGERIYGLGACDTKGGAAAQLAALLSLARKWNATLPTIEWQGVADEEDGSGQGTEFLAGQGLLKADLAVVAEPTNGRVSVQQFGSVWMEVSILGQQAHGGMPWLGHDAIAAALDVIARMKARVYARTRAPAAPFHPAVGVRIFEGGGHAGTVAGTCRFVADIRVPPGEERAAYIALWQQVAQEIETEFSVSITLNAASGGGCNPNSLTDTGLLGVIEQTWQHAFEEPLMPQVFFGGSDARYFTACGVPSIVLGAGDLAHAHSPDEFTPVADVLRCERFLKSLPLHF